MTDNHLSSDELHRLGNFLGSDSCGENALRIDELQGLLTAIACYPLPIGIEEWIVIVFGGQPHFIDTNQSSDITDLLMRFHESLSEDLYTGEQFQPLFAKLQQSEATTTYPVGWCSGFVAGMNLRRTEWLARINADLGHLLAPILMLAREGETDESQLGEDLYNQLLQQIPKCVGAIYIFWHSVVKQTLNCPCGSGRLFDQCCGRSNRDLH